MSGDLWETAVRHVLQWEGGEVNDPRDPGGRTKYGISHRAHPDVDLDTLTREKASVIYREHYWDTCRCSELPPPVAVMVFDSSVNQGTRRAAKILQESLSVPADGVIGAGTIRAAASANTEHLLQYLFARRVYSYMLTPNARVFGLGWALRVVDTYDLCRKLL